MEKRAPDAANGDSAKKARTEGPGDEPLEVRRELFKAKGLFGADYEGKGSWTLVAPGHGSFASAQPVELQYFALRGLGQLPQLCLEVAGYPYRYQVVLSPYFKDHLKSKLAFGRLPCVKTLGGKEIAQSKAVLRYTAKLCGLAGEGDDEAAVCDMVHEMLLTDAKVDEIQTLAGCGKTIADAADATVVSRREQAELSDVEACLNAVKFWEDTLARSSATGGEWLLAGLEAAKMTKLCYVDLALFWKLRTHISILEELGCKKLVEHTKKVAALPGFLRLVESGRLMPNIGQPGYAYQEDDLVKKT